GEITFDRSPVGLTHVVENPGAATPDFSDQGILESFETMIAFMKERYVFNTFNDVDWDALAEAVRPQVEQADAEGSLGRYAVALLDLAQAVGDAHVYVDPSLVLTDPAERAVWNEFQAFGSAGVGATTVELDDGRIIVNQVTPDGPADAAGLTFGTEVVSINGRPASEVLVETSYPWPNFPGSPEARRFTQATYLLNEPAGTQVEVGYILPDTTEVMTTTFTAAELERPQAHRGIMPVDYSLVDGYGYVTWPGFTRTGISSHIFSDFVKRMNQQQIPGIILDLRSNGGGSALLEYAMLSYLYSADEPFTFAGETNYRFNTETGEFISDFNELTLSAPENATAYPGEVVVLVDQVCASACEFMSYYLQFTERATVIGQYASTGAGGNTNQVILPGHITFNYTAGTNLLDETGLPTFQGVGVVPDVRVPVTEASEQAKLEGDDPVLDAAVTYLHEQELKALELAPKPFAEGQITMTIPPNWVPNESMTKYTSPDDESIIAVAPYTTTNDIEPDAIEQRIDEDAEKVGEYKTDLATWSIYHTPFGDQAAAVFVATIDETPYVGVLIAKDDDFRDLLQRYILEPALDSFEIVEE
ncbi:MAG: PDZ domain-containing protein, partial [Anaerolineae bacterium]|nr:PDZ domain-containing protein [Anaerolineae bacterium]